MNAHRRTQPEPTEAEIEAAKDALRGEKAAAEWPTSKCAGVAWNGYSWRAKATDHGKVISLGSFPTEAEAVAAVLAYRKDHPKGTPGRKKSPEPEPAAGVRRSVSRPALAEMTVASLPAEPEPEPEADHILQTEDVAPEPEAPAAPPVGLKTLGARLKAAVQVTYNLQDLDPDSARWVLSTVWESLGEGSE